MIIIKVRIPELFVDSLNVQCNIRETKSVHQKFIYSSFPTFIHIDQACFCVHVTFSQWNIYEFWVIAFKKWM